MFDGKAQGPEAAWLLEWGFRSALVLPIPVWGRVKGALTLGSAKAGAFAELSPHYLAFLTRFLAFFSDRVLRTLQADAERRRLARERDQEQLLLDINNQLVRHLDPRELFQAIASTVRDGLGYDSVNLTLVDEETQQLRLQFLDFPTGRGFMRENAASADPHAPARQAMDARKPTVFRFADLSRFRSPVLEALVQGEGLRAICCVPLFSRNRILGSLNFGSRREDVFGEDDVHLLASVANQVAIALDNAFAYQEIQVLRDRLAEEKLYLEEEMGEVFVSGEIIGHSPALQRVLRQVQTVAPSDATVLLLGETGTGKELMARAIHNLSGRKDRTFVKMNCAAIPLGLVESELFGHEKGAFTGAIAQKMGRLELAHRGTLFLDEIGDLPLELQPKLLRAIQEREFERLGGTRTQRVDVRLIAATNRDLAGMVEARAFRSDLYYRLNVFPVQMPPLRERREDIPLLVRYFVQKYSQRLNRRIQSIPASAMQAMVDWSWPGNIRELENLVERSVILSPGGELRVPVAELGSQEVKPPAPLSTLVEAERAHILEALRQSGGKVGGPQGAAARLGLKRSTLQSRMRKLGLAGVRVEGSADI